MRTTIITLNINKIHRNKRATSPLALLVRRALLLTTLAMAALAKPRRAAVRKLKCAQHKRNIISYYYYCCCCWCRRALCLVCEHMCGVMSRAAHNAAICQRVGSFPMVVNHRFNFSDRIFNLTKESVKVPHVRFKKKKWKHVEFQHVKTREREHVLIYSVIESNIIL